MTVEIPYPAVFRDWKHPDERVAAGTGTAGIRVEMLVDSKRGLWKWVELTETDACLLAATLLRAAGHKKLTRRVLRRLERDVHKNS